VSSSLRDAAVAKGKRPARSLQSIDVSRDRSNVNEI
jgi:hypothetical protein